MNFGETNIRALAASAALVTITMLSALMPAALIAPASAAMSSAIPARPLVPALGIAVPPLSRPGGAAAVAGALLNSNGSIACSVETASAAPMMSLATSPDAASCNSFVSRLPISNFFVRTHRDAREHQIGDRQRQALTDKRRRRRLSARADIRN